LVPIIPPRGRDPDNRKPKFYGIEMPDDVAMTTQERAYTSPIWYTPK
jgi:hypothetical protein